MCGIETDLYCMLCEDCEKEADRRHEEFADKCYNAQYDESMYDYGD
jgi:hypothetical protein